MSRYPDLPWAELASNFEYIHQNKDRDDITNLFPCSRPDQGKQLVGFLKAFIDAIEEACLSERAKYPECYEPPKPDDIILDDATTAKLASTVYRYSRHDRSEAEEALWYEPQPVDPDMSWWHRDYEPEEPYRRQIRNHSGTELCQHPGPNSDCSCIIRLEDRQMKSFLQEYEFADCYRFYETGTNASTFRNNELLKTMLLFGDMDPILRVMSHPETFFQARWSVCQCMCMGNEDGIGWNGLCRKALQSFFTLNLLRCCPSLLTTGPDSRQNSVVVGDYRDTALYQAMLNVLSLRSESRVEGYRHLEFFDFERPRDDGMEVDPGRLPFKEIYTTAYAANAADCDMVRSVLTQQGLPMEVALNIMEFAQYRPTRVLNVADDPLHPDNSDQLEEYLTDCWNIMVRCEMMAKAADGSAIDWCDLMSRHISELLGVENGPIGAYMAENGYDPVPEWAKNKQRRRWDSNTPDPFPYRQLLSY